MSNRTLRVNELIQRELSDILHRRYQSEAVAITISEVRVAPDLRDARLFVSIVGNDEMVEKKLKSLRATLPDLRIELGRRIVLKYMPRFTIALDKSTARGNRILQALDELGQNETPETEQE
ncbi:MAG: 30S ribosome-binding factor RbfA [Nibricoccus sp.]